MKVRTFITCSILLTGIILFGVPQFRSKTIQILSYSTCDTPIPYKLGTLDPKFDLNQTTALADIQSAANIWDKVYGKPLFINSPKASLTIHFVYDQRSALNSQIDQLQNQLDQKKTRFQQQINSYEADVAIFEQKLAQFNEQVDQINRSGGAHPDMINSLTDQQNKLRAEGDSLNERARQLNLVAHDYNSKAQNLNQDVSQFNQAIAQKPEEGLYNGNDNTITIYFVDNKQELIHTLAHEFGHALGMEHTISPQSIMYPLSTSSLSVTPEDKEELTYVCREQLLPVLWYQEFGIWLRSAVKSFSKN